MGQQHDVADALAAQGVDGGLGGFGLVAELRAGQRARGVGGFVGDGQTDDADLDGVGLHLAGQWRAGGRLDVGGEHRCFAVALSQLVQEVFEDTVAVVEFVVAQGEGVKAHGVHHPRVGLALEEGVVQRAGDGITRVQLEQVGR